MAKWADKLISEVCFNGAHTHIDSIRYRTENDESEISVVKGELTRSQVVLELRSNKTFCTIVRTADNKWSRGAKVEIFPVNGVDYIKTKADSSTADNLDNLPEY